MSRFHVRREAALRRIGQIGPFVAASLAQVDRRCSHPGCKCARGAPHRAWLLSYKLPGQKSRSVHVPKSLVTEVQAWVQEYRRLKTLIARVSYNSLQIVRRHVRSGRAAGGGR